MFHSWLSRDFRSPYSRAASHTLALFPMPVEFPHTFSRPPHAATRLHISPYVLRGSPIPLSSSINPTPNPPRPAFRPRKSSANRPGKFRQPAYPVSTYPQPAGPRKFSKACGGWHRRLLHGHGAQAKPAETSGRSTQTYASDRFTQIPRDGRPYVGIDIMGGHCMLWSGLKPDKQAVPEGLAPVLQSGLKPDRQHWAIVRL